MRITDVILCISIPVLLCSCEQQNRAAGIDPGLGLACYESRRDAFPPGTQYEGIEKLSGDELKIRVMTGAELVTIGCRFNPDGTIRDD